LRALEDRQPRSQRAFPIGHTDILAPKSSHRTHASRIAGVDDDDKLDEARKAAPIEGRMLAAHTAIYTASDDETLVKLSVGVVALGRDLARVASAIPFDPAAYETLRSMFERTFRALRQRARALSDLPAVTGAPTNETSDGCATVRAVGGSIEDA
jgi:hypothetical protein